MPNFVRLNEIPSRPINPYRSPRREVIISYINIRLFNKWKAPRNCGDDKRRPITPCKTCCTDSTAWELPAASPDDRKSKQPKIWGRNAFYDRRDVTSVIPAEHCNLATTKQNEYSSAMDQEVTTYSKTTETRGHLASGRSNQRWLRMQQTAWGGVAGSSRVS